MMFSADHISSYLANMVQLARKSVGLAFVIVASLMMSHMALAQTGRPISGVIAATDKPIAISYVNEDGQKIGRIAGVGEPIYLNDEISTPAGASLQVLLRDQTVFSIGPNSTLVFDEFIFDPTSGDDLALTASVKKGTFKFISGKISKLKPGAMTLKLPNATASVRGTSVVGRVDDTGASDIVLLTGAVQLQATGTAGAVDLITPGWGVSIADTGAASDPELFPEEAISEIIAEVEFAEEEAGEAPADEATLAEESEDTTAEEEATEEEAVETIATAIQEAGEEVTEEEIITIIEEADGDPEAVAEAIVKVIIENQIERGEVAPELLEVFESVDGEALLNGEISPETFDVAVFDELNIEDIKIEDLGLEGFAFDEQATFIEAFSERLDTEGVELDIFDAPELLFSEAEFGFDDAQFNDVIFEPVVFETQFATTTKFDIKEVSSLILGNEFEGTDTPDIELSFFDILFNAETINEELNRREASFDSFPTDEAAFDDGKSDQVVEDNSFAETNAPEAEFKVPSFSIARDAQTGLARVVVTPPTEQGGTEAGTDDGGFTDSADQTFEEPKTDAPDYTATELVFAQLVEDKPQTQTDVPSYEPEYNDEKEVQANRLEFESFLEQLQLQYGDSAADPLEFYKSGNSGALWLTYQSDRSLGNPNPVDDLISSSYSGTARFTDSVTISDSNTAFKARSSYDVTLNYSTAALTGKLVLSNMSLSGTNYVGPTGDTSYTQILNQTLSTSNNKLAATDSAGSVTGGDDENGNGTLDVGETIEGVRIATVDFHDSATASEITSRVRTTLDMSVGSTVAIDSALDGTLGEFVITSEEYACNNPCNNTFTKSGAVGSAISQVAAE